MKKAIGLRICSTGVLFLFLGLSIIGCTSLLKPKEPTYEEIMQSQRKKYGDPQPKGYQPLDPIPVVLKAQNGDIVIKQLLEALPNEAVRLVIGKEDSSGNVTFGPFTAAAKLGSYVVILDYIKYKSASLPVVLTDEQAQQIRSTVEDEYKSGKLTDTTWRTELINRLNEYNNLVPYWARPFTLQFPKKEDFGIFDATGSLYYIPVYVGIGVRMVASVTVSDTSVDLGSLYGLAAAAQSNKLQGTLIIQTLGISGSNISSQIPLPSEINVTTIQGAIQSLATIKSKVYDETNVLITPEIVAIDDNIGRPGSKELIVSGLRDNADQFMITTPGQLKP